jgi:predicted RND superfamily exporter protein
MYSLRDRIQKWFKNLASIFYSFPKITIFLMLAVSFLLAAQLPKLKLDLSAEGLLHKQDPSLIEYNKFRDQFGREGVIIIPIASQNIFDLPFLEKLKLFQNEIVEKVPYLKEVTSLINARNTYGDEDTLYVEELFENWPENSTELNSIKEYALSNKLYNKMLFSEDLKYTAILIETKAYSSLNDDVDGITGMEEDITQEMEINPQQTTSKKYITDKETNEAIKAIQAIAEKYDSPEFQIQIGGYPVVVYFLKATLTKETAIFMVVSILTIFLFLYIMFRRISVVVLTLSTVILSLLSTFGIMALLNIPFKLPTQILPSFLITIGVADSVHIFRIFFMHFDENGNKKESIMYAFGHSGLACFLTTITTAAALFTFITATVDPVADLGVCASIGVMIAFLYTVILLPAAIAVIPIKIRDSGNKITKLMERFLAFLSKFNIKHPNKIFVISLLIIIVAATGLTKLKFSYYPLMYFDETHPIRTTTQTIDKHLAGTINLEVIIDTEKENGLYDPTLLNRIEKSIEYIKTLSIGEHPVGKIWSITTILKEINQALHENKKEFYQTPQDENLVAQEFLLFENTGSDDLEYYTNSKFSKGRLSIRVPFTDASDCLGFMQKVSNHFSNEYPKEQITITGLRILLNKTFTNAILSMMKSYILSIIVIIVLMILFIGNVRIGLLSMLPNLAPIITIMGLMGFMDIKLDLFSMCIGSILIGIVVDDTIHFMNSFIIYFNKRRGVNGDIDINGAIFDAFRTTGSAMFITTIALFAGMSVYMLSSMQNLSDFGFALSMGILLALIFDYFMIPSMLIVFRRFFRFKLKS